MNIIKNIKKIAQDVLKIESEAIQKLTQYIDNSFEACVQEIYSANGRVVITGIGKSAIIANKIVATLNSAGTPSHGSTTQTQRLKSCCVCEHCKPYARRMLQKDVNIGTINFG